MAVSQVDARNVEIAIGFGPGGVEDGVVEVRQFGRPDVLAQGDVAVEPETGPGRHAVVQLRDRLNLLVVGCHAPPAPGRTAWATGRTCPPVRCAGPAAGNRRRRNRRGRNPPRPRGWVFGGGAKVTHGTQFPYRGRLAASIPAASILPVDRPATQSGCAGSWRRAATTRSGRRLDRPSKSTQTCSVAPVPTRTPLSLWWSS